jgi:hypothetical protein
MISAGFLHILENFFPTKNINFQEGIAESKSSVMPFTGLS